MNEETSNFAGYVSLALIGGTAIYSAYQLVKLGKKLTQEVVRHAEDTLTKNK